MPRYPVTPVSDAVEVLHGESIPDPYRWLEDGESAETREWTERQNALTESYLGAVPVFANRDLSKAAASILGDEAMHWAILRQALGEDPVPSAFVS